VQITTVYSQNNTKPQIHAAGENAQVLNGKAGGTYVHHNNLKGYRFLIPVVGFNFKIFRSGLNISKLIN
jgi:hypothetical protein